MRKVKIVTDSTCDLNKEDIIKYNIEVLPLYVNFGDKSYKDNIDITVPTLYEEVKKCGELPKTAALTLNDFNVCFKKYIDEDYDIIYTGISSYMSSCFNNANLIKNEFPEERIRIVDSKNLSTGIGLVVLKAAKMALNGDDINTIADEMERIVPLVRSQFAIETFEYLYKGGRCSSMSKIFGTLLKIKPIIVVRDGKMTVGRKPHGPMKKALDVLLEMIKNDKDNLDGDVVMITHSLAPKYKDYLNSELSKLITTKEIMVTDAGCVISSHCGSGTIGILYILNK